jgi:hypothetical protein
MFVFRVAYFTLARPGIDSAVVWTICRPLRGPMIKLTVTVKYKTLRDFDFVYEFVICAKTQTFIIKVKGEVVLVFF